MGSIRIEIGDELFDALAKDEDLQAIGISGFFRVTMKS